MKMIQPYSFLFYILAIVLSFFIGMLFAGFVEAGKNQGLAGGAIVFGYGVMGAGLGLIVSLLIAYKANRKIIIRLNLILALIITGLFLYTHFKYKERQKQKVGINEKIDRSTIPTVSLLEEFKMAVLKSQRHHLI